LVTLVSPGKLNVSDQPLMVVAPVLVMVRLAVRPPCHSLLL